MDSYAIYLCRNCQRQFRRNIKIHLKHEPQEFLPILLQNNNGVAMHVCSGFDYEIIGVGDLIAGRYVKE